MHDGYISSISTMIYDKLYHDCGLVESWKHALNMDFHECKIVIFLLRNVKVINTGMP